ncbi:hypothetical protein GCM10011579_008930 [Streptomyces albiflavescens]|uniref:Uncharacterized protein n=1 Tax=Streptomyces albiflavescens TaxID=1623582 RepID=A0A917XT92_9ACTN|nr:hypothetical protein GCM10011579_008930 [Streptomyces albiflavescens]
MRTDAAPATRTEHHLRFKGEPARGKHRGEAMDRWQIEVTAGGPQIPGPASLMVPNAVRRTGLSPSRTLSGTSRLACCVWSPRSLVDAGQPLGVERDRRIAETRKKIPPSVA